MNKHSSFLLVLAAPLLLCALPAHAALRVFLVYLALVAASYSAAFLIASRIASRFAASLTSMSNRLVPLSFC